MSAYCETCAAIGNVYVNYRLFLLHGESKYYDVLERTLYNGLISGVSLDGGSFFYPNPLESIGQHQRQAWFGCACCPSNICRFIPSLPGYIYAVKDDNVFVNLFMGNTATLKVGKRALTLQQETAYPYDGDVVLTVKKGSGDFALNIRIPGWVRNQVVPSDLYQYSDNKRLSYRLQVNGVDYPVSNADLRNGYAVISRKWKKGDQVQIHFDMEARVVKANAQVEADLGRVSVERGPLVYCAEWPDNPGFDVRSVLINQTPEFKLEDKAILDKYPVKMLSTSAQVLKFNDMGELAATGIIVDAVRCLCGFLRNSVPARPLCLPHWLRVPPSRPRTWWLVLVPSTTAWFPRVPRIAACPTIIIGPSRAVRSGLNITSPRLTPSRVPPSIGSTILHGVAARFLPDGASSTSRPMASGPR